MIFNTKRLKVKKKYLFDKEKRTLTGIVIYFIYTDENALIPNETKMNDLSAAIKDSLMSIYGNPLPTDGKNWETKPGVGLLDADLALKELKDLSTTGVTYDGNVTIPSEWIVKSNGYNIGIDLVNLCLTSHIDKDGLTLYSYVSFIGYRKYIEADNDETPGDTKNE